MSRFSNECSKIKHKKRQQKTNCQLCEVYIYVVNYFQISRMPETSTFVSKVRNADTTLYQAHRSIRMRTIHVLINLLGQR